MKKIFSMVLILGICTSFGALAHGPPGHTDKLSFIEKEMKISQVTAMEKIFAVEVAGAETNYQALPAGYSLENFEFSTAAFGVSKHRGIRRPPTLNAHWRVDRSRFRWCDSL